MPFTWGNDDYIQMRKLLAKQSFLKTESRQLDFVTSVYASTPDAKILDHLGSRNDSFTYAVYLLDELGRWDNGRVTQRLIEALIDRLGEDGDVEFLHGLKDRYFSTDKPQAPAATPPATPTANSTTLTAFEPTSLMVDLARLRTELRQLHEPDRADVTEILQAFTLQQNGYQELQQDVDKLRAWAAIVLQDIRNDQIAIRAQLETLTQHNTTANQYLMASIPIIPGLLSYNVELGSSHAADLRAIWDKFKSRLRGSRARDASSGTETPATQNKAGAARSFALLTGVNTYEPNSGISTLRFCARDVAAIDQVLGQSGFQTMLYADGLQSAPIREDILTALVSLAGNAGSDDLLLFYFSGHGTTEDGEGYLLPRNTRPGIMVDTALKTARVLEIMNNSPARKKVLVLDACHSGAQIGKAGTAMTPEFIEQVYRQAEGVAVLASCAQRQVSWEDNDLQHGVFTCAVLEGLSGLADFEAKGFVTVQDLHRYTRDRVAAWGRAKGKVQTPTLKFEGSGDMILINL